MEENHSAEQVVTINMYLHLYNVHRKMCPTTNNPAMTILQSCNGHAYTCTVLNCITVSDPIILTYVIIEADAWCIVHYAIGNVQTDPMALQQCTVLYVAHICMYICVTLHVCGGIHITMHRHAVARASLKWSQKLHYNISNSYSPLSAI